MSAIITETRVTSATVQSVISEKFNVKITQHLQLVIQRVMLDRQIKTDLTYSKLVLCGTLKMPLHNVPTTGSTTKTIVVLTNAYFADP